MTEWQILIRVEIPLGLPLLIGGLRSASLQVIATATLADYVSGGGLGHFLFLGLQTNNYPEMLGGSIVVIVLALASEGLFGLLQRLVVPAGVAARQPKDVRLRPVRSQTALG
jgi:osmoprotectant transport system permease protein